MSTTTVDTCCLKQYEEQMVDYKAELRTLSREILSLDLEEGDALLESEAALTKAIFDCSVEIKRLLQSHSSASGAGESKGVKLPKLDIPTFDGHLLNWTSFWEQFTISVHGHSDISNAEKLVYLRNALKDGAAKHIVEGLSRSGEQYAEAVECLQARFSRPRLIHQAHVRVVLEAPGLKDGSGRELRRLHDTVQQHLRALKAMDYEPSGPFVTSVLELKLDSNTMFEWHKHTQTSTDVPHYLDLMEFINLHAQASETSTADRTRKPHKGELDPKVKSFVPSKHVASLTANATPVMSHSCVLCKSNKHPLYVCPTFKSLPYDKMVMILKENGICMNCLRGGHFVKQCKSHHRCRHCQKPHHTLLQIEAEVPPASRLPTDPVSSTSLSPPAGSPGTHSCRDDTETKHPTNDVSYSCEFCSRPLYGGTGNLGFNLICFVCLGARRSKPPSPSISPSCTDLWRSRAFSQVPLSVHNKLRCFSCATFGCEFRCHGCHRVSCNL